MSDTVMVMHRLRIHGDVGILMPQGARPKDAREALMVVLADAGLDVWPDEELEPLGPEVVESGIEWEGATEVPA